ncbi:MAG: N-glycosylase/DNA lyase [Thermoplasmatales archaeon]|nr:N-glycosylase/DNA lyase [Thermoplasmatales archaeon]
MEKLIDKIESLKKGEIGKLVNNRIKEFKNIDKKSTNELFNEMCFCILTANFNAEKSIKIQNEIGECFSNDSEEDLAKKLQELGHRFPNMRASYISESRNCKDMLKRVVESLKNDELREWLVKNVKGIGYKETSHFLRNIGFDDFAIIDFHIIDILAKYDLIEKPKALTRKKYLEIEKILKKIAEKSGLNLAELDLYLWYMETGKILK